MRRCALSRVRTRPSDVPGCIQNLQTQGTQTARMARPTENITHEIIMTSISLPIFGQGSQPAEQDGVELEYLQMPQEMTTYRMPQISTDLNAQDLAQAKSILQQLQQNLAAFPSVSAPIELTQSGCRQPAIYRRAARRRRSQRDLFRRAKHPYSGIGAGRSLALAATQCPATDRRRCAGSRHYPATAFAIGL